MLKNIVFDMGMVLMIWNPMQSCLRHCKTKEQAVRLHQLIFQSPDWVSCIDTGRMQDDEYTEFILPRASEEDKPYVRAILSDFWIDAVYPKPGMDAFVKELLQEGYRLYLLSNVGYCFHKLSYKMDYLDCFSGVLLSCEQRLIKPDPAIYRRLCELYGLRPEECLFVDDVERNAEGARSVGMQAVVFDGNPECVRKVIRQMYRR